MHQFFDLGSLMNLMTLLLDLMESGKNSHFGNITG